MGATLPLVISLAEAASIGERWVGGKAAKLSELAASGFRVPTGCCVTTRAYQRFLEDGDLKSRIDMEIGRKAMSSMRWEEIWDAALRIRTAFLRTSIPPDVSRAIVDALQSLEGRSLVVRSSAVGEDSSDTSFAGLHESVVDVRGEAALLDAVRIVWASLWSDAALLYRQELELDATNSAMAVVVQELIAESRSGVAFGRDPREPAGDSQIVEAVPGLCRDLVDGAVDPDRWLIRRSSGAIIEWKPGLRPQQEEVPLLDDEDVGLLHRTLNTIETNFGWPPDIEWTGRGADLTVLQARPITIKAARDANDQREWYLSLRPGRSKLAALCKRVTEELIPELETEGRRLAAEPVENSSDEQLADAIDARAAIHTRWKKTYWDEFIPFAHGVRQLGTYYNDAVKPADPYEFIGILQHQPMIAAERNAALDDLAVYLENHAALHEALRDISMGRRSFSKEDWPAIRETLAGVDGGTRFIDEFARVCEQYMDVAHDGEQLDTRPDLVLHTVVELAGQREAAPVRSKTATETAAPTDYENRLLDAVGPNRRDEALAVITIARLSWRLRDDDNVLLGRVEKQLLRALKIAAERLERSGRLEAGARYSVESAPVLSAALRDVESGRIVLGDPPDPDSQALPEAVGESPRQVVGQPAAPGLATARARVVRTTDDFSNFHAGEVLVCDAIQPTMSHIVPLAAAIIERRGGMLIHGAIIARELGIPCVNGVSDAILSFADGEIVTVDGYLGIVTIGPPEFDLETARSAAVT